MLLLTGDHKHVIDEKGRVLVSNKLRNQIDVDEHGSGLYFVWGPNGILCLYPEKCFARLVSSMAPRGQPGDEAVASRRILFGRANKVELDGQGRLLLGEKLRTQARLKDDVTLVGVEDHIELWNTQDWEQYVTDHMPQYQQQIVQAWQSVPQQEEAKEV